MALTFLIPFLLLTADYSQAVQEECVSRDYNLGGTVCVCNAEHCDTIPRPEKLEQPQFLTYTTNKAGLRFQKVTGEFTQSDDPVNQIRINSETKFQTILGWGGAFTDSSGINIAALDEDLQDKILRSYFGEDGIEYTLCRVPIAGTDMSTHGYSYDDGDVDEELANFALAEEDYLYKIPYIKKALELTENLELFASAWTAPKWMKTNGEYSGYGFLKEEFWQLWAEYLVKFLDEYHEEGVEFWGITTGNEPFTAREGVLVNAVGWNATDMGSWIMNNLGPTIRSSNHSDVKIMTLDDQREYLLDYVDTALADSAAAGYIDGIAVHWYTDQVTSPSILTETHEHFPDKFLLYTEACWVDFNGSGAVHLGSWERGQEYSLRIIEDLQNWATGWIDFNLAMDETGGPTYVNTPLDAIIIVNATAGEFYKQPMYYHLGHFSKFIPKGSMKIESSSDLEARVTFVAFQRPDDGTVVVLSNQEEEAVTVSIVDDARGTAEIELNEKSITTLLYW